MQIHSVWMNVSDQQLFEFFIEVQLLFKIFLLFFIKSMLVKKNKCTLESLKFVGPIFVDY